MRREKPNSLQRALVSADAGPHPDANVLTAFAEDALLPRERESVLAHVACCAECREVLSLSGSAAGPYAVASPAAHRKRTGWRIAVPLLAAAAMIAVVSTLVLRHVVNNPQQNATVAKNAEVTANQPAPTTAVSPPTEAGASAQKERRREDRRPAPLATGPVVVTPPTPVPPAIAANVAPSPPEAAIAESAERQTEAARVPMAKPASPPSRLALQAPAQASAFANSVTTHALGRASAASIARPHWRINEQGQPERAFGDGAWQPVLPNGSAKMHTLAVFVGEVWVGENAQVFRSLDNGTSWRIVALPDKDGTNHTIAHIRFNSAQEITIEASDGTAWTTTDGGASWK